MEQFFVKGIPKSTANMGLSQLLEFEFLSSNTFSLIALILTHTANI